MAVRLAGMPGAGAERHCPVAPTADISGFQSTGVQIPVPILRRRLGEHGPKATITELASHAAYLATGGAMGQERVSSHPLESLALSGDPIPAETKLL